MKGFFVTGTDTGVGKTVVAAGMAAHLRSRGMNVGVMKPIATGCRRIGRRLISEDAELLIRAAGVEDPLERVNPISLALPMSPNLASRIARRPIRLEQAWSAFRELRRRHEVLIIEGIGGLMVPIRGHYFVADLAREFGFPLIVVSRPGLGTLNHTVMTMEIARARGLKVAAVVINHAAAGKRGLIERTNVSCLRQLCRVPVYEVPYLGSRLPRVFPLRHFSFAARL